jgi:FkbM family methyltransferase
MMATTPVVAGGANRFRRRGVIERLAGWGARWTVNPAIRRHLKRWYHYALTLQSRGAGLPRVLPGGEVIRVLPQYEYLGWNPDEYRAFREAVRPGMVALDVGANVGAYSTLLGRWVGASGAVFAFEPAPGVFDGLVRHIEINGLTGIVRPIAAAVGGLSTTAPFLVADSAGESRLAGDSESASPQPRTFSPQPPASCLQPPASGVRTISVPVTTIDEFCARERLAPDFIKIDVEGAELSALRGARETIRARRGHLALFVEMHPSIWPALGFGREDLVAELRAQSLEAQPLIPVADIWALEGICLRLVAV